MKHFETTVLTLATMLVFHLIGEVVDFSHLVHVAHVTVR